MATGYEVRMYADITRIANALERIAEALEAQAPVARHPEPGSPPKLPQTAFNLEG